MYKIRDDVKDLDQKLRFNAIFRRTTYFHELRHYHDALSTSIGIERRIMLDKLLVNQIAGLMDIRSYVPIRVPFILWADKPKNDVFQKIANAKTKLGIFIGYDPAT